MIIYKTDTIDSTNTEMRRRIEDGSIRPEPGECFMITAKHQTGGRGRKGRVFESNDDSGIYMTVAYQTRVGIEGAMAVTSSFGVIVARAIRQLTGLKADIKWVNDVYVGDKKVCGILAEGCTPADEPGKFYVILGIGINLSTEGMSEELLNIAGGIAEGKPLEFRERLRDNLIEMISAESEKYIAKEDFGDYYDDYVAFSNCIGREVTYFDGGGSFDGKAVGIDSKGALLVERQGRIETLNTGEITLRIKRG